MREFSKWVTRISSAVRYSLQGAAGLTDLGTHSGGEYHNNPPPSNEKISEHITDVFRPLMIAVIIFEGLRFLMNLYDMTNRWFRYKEALTIESFTKLSYSALLLTLMICTIVVSLPIFLLAVSAIYFCKDIGLFFYYAMEFKTLARKEIASTNGQSVIEMYNYLGNAVISAFLLTASVLFFLAPVAMSLPAAIIFCTAFLLAAIKFFCVHQPHSTIGAERYVDISLGEITQHILITDNMSIESKLDAILNRVNALFALAENKRTPSAPSANVQGEPDDAEESQPGNTSPEGKNTEDKRPIEGKKKFIAQLINAHNFTHSHVNAKSAEEMHNAYLQLKEQIEAIRQDASKNPTDWAFGGTFFTPLRTRLLPDILRTIEASGEKLLNGDKYEELCDKAKDNRSVI